MNEKNAATGSSHFRPAGLRIFLASPGDVRDERALARAVIEQIRLERAFRERVNLEIIAWDQPGVEVAMEAVQVFGGYGYTREYPVEQLMRDPEQDAVQHGGDDVPGASRREALRDRGDPPRVTDRLASI